MRRRQRFKELRQLRAWRDDVLGVENLGRKHTLFVIAIAMGLMTRIWLTPRNNGVVLPDGWVYHCQCDKRGVVFEHLTAAVYRHHSRLLRGKPVEEA